MKNALTNREIEAQREAVATALLRGEIELTDALALLCQRSAAGDFKSQKGG